MEGITLINPLHASVVDRIDPQFAEIYNKYQGLQFPTLGFSVPL
jgi:hypothetical protein